jgi:hypothetical protein
MLYRLGGSTPNPRRLRSLRDRRRSRLRVEELESRTLLSVFTPADIRQAYGFDQTGLDGSGQTIAIIDAYHNPYASRDLATFSSQFGLPQFNSGFGAPTFTQATPQGLAQTDLGWSGETALDTEWAHAVAPKANLLLVEAASASLTDLLGAVQYASRQPGVVAVSMSWGTNEFAGETAYDSVFTTPAGHVGGSGLPGGITYVASSGDNGAWSGAEWPASSPNVVSVGGTALSVAGGSYAGETAWSSYAPWYGGSGGGISQYESEPAYQAGVQQTGARTIPDVAYNASPSSGYSVYDQTNGGWLVAGGTSAGAPQWAGLVALADQGRAQHGEGSLDGATQILPALYQLGGTSSATYFHGVTSGTNGDRAGPGYNLVTGLGSPHADALVQALTTVTGSGSGLSIAGTTTTTTPPTATSPPKHRATRTAHHHNLVVAGSSGNGATQSAPVTSGSAPVSTSSDQASLPTPPLPSRMLVPPSPLPAAATPAVAGAPAAQPAALTQAPAPVPVAAVRTSGIDVLSGGGGDNSLLPPDGSDGDDQGPAVPNISVPDVVPAPAPGDVRVAEAGPIFDRAGPRSSDVYFMEESATAVRDTGAVIEDSAGALRPLAAAGLALFLGGFWGDAARVEMQQQADDARRRR